MGQPYPPAGNQSQQTERPLKIYAEQYLEGQPLPIGVVTEFTPLEGFVPPFSDGVPRVLTPAGWIVVNLTDWVISSRYSGKPIEVISADEFAERFGPSA